MIKLEDALFLHANSIARYGGGEGVRDMESLRSAIERPFATWAGENLYKDVFEQAAAIGESIVMNHPFVDGNKRTGLALIYAVLRLEDVILNATPDEVYQFVVDLATGEKRFEEAVEWLRAHSGPASKQPLLITI
jgi:death-on-curing protein